MYLCDEHLESLSGNLATWYFFPDGRPYKCEVCGKGAIYNVVSITLTETNLQRYVICINNTPSRAKDIFQNGKWEFNEEELKHFCTDCHYPLTLVRPGKYQCDTPWCPSNQKEETK